MTSFTKRFSFRSRSSSRSSSDSSRRRRSLDSVESVEPPSYIISLPPMAAPPTRQPTTASTAGAQSMAEMLDDDNCGWGSPATAPARHRGLRK
ncbi:uncharacterized protein BXZ73DRAFT_102615 [Epithele typhae]|uniref:uncharacterized protein n=1 Tax=Epithele typhae TaxID=378194 RepID=UPI002007BDA8|nr:uncharacterized protein BXZ73DRAFT_102615 [Epithele typhae]KAH9927483.1 hypothetical protein BXZ73DRAFT_102615 [Epithele typhae]